MGILKIGSNTKLGKGVATFSLPAVSTCPGRTKHCESICYATSGFFTMPNVKRSLTNGLKESKDPAFVSNINGELKRRRSIRAVRIHPAGDFYSVKYLQDWIAIAKANPQHKFWAYTRSWRLPKFRKVLKEFATLPNVQLWASMDQEIKANAEQPPAWLRKADVVKTWDQSPDRSYMQCPNQKASQVTCIKCSYCFKPQGPKKLHVVFKEH